MALTKFMNKVSGISRRKAALKRREELRRAKANFDINTSQIAPGEAPPPKKLSDLGDKETSGWRSSTNMTVFFVFLLVIAALGYLIYYLYKGIGNPAISEYPNQLVHRDSRFGTEAEPLTSFVDLEQGTQSPPPHAGGKSEKYNEAPLAE